MSTPPQPPETVAALVDVSFRRGGALLLSGITLTVTAGQHWALLGPNGAGKTTLLGLLGALHHPSHGTVQVLGRPLGRVDVAGELWPRIGHVQGRHRPSGPLTCGELVLTGLTGTNALPLRWQPTGDDHDAAERALSAVGLCSLRSRMWSSLSNGEQRRALIARALVRTPDLLLLDEPTAGLDLAAREHLLEVVAGLTAQRPLLTSVLVSHYLEELPASTSHAALLRDGRLLVAGPSTQVLTSAWLSQCFGLPLQVGHSGGHWSAHLRR